MLRKHYPGVERMNQTDRAIAKASPSLLELADAMCRLHLDREPTDEVDLAAHAYKKARGL